MFLVFKLQVNFNHDFGNSTGKSLSEALIFASTNPQYDDRLFIELQVQYMKIPSSNLGRTCCVQKLFLTFRTIFVHNMFSPCSAKRRASDKDLPVLTVSKNGRCKPKNLPPLSIIGGPEKLVSKVWSWKQYHLL